MKKLISVFFVLVIAVSANAQTKTASKLGGSSPKGPNKNDSIMCSKDWKVTGVEEWGILTKPPGEKNKTDMLHMSIDGKFELVMFGAKKTGTWIRNGVYIYFTEDATKTKFNFKILSVDAAKLRVDHYSDEDGHSIFEYE